MRDEFKERIYQSVAKRRRFAIPWWLTTFRNKEKLGEDVKKLVQKLGQLP